MGNSDFLGLTPTTVAFVCQFYVSDVPGVHTLAYAKVEENWKPLMVIGMGFMFNSLHCKVDKQIH